MRANPPVADRERSTTQRRSRLTLSIQRRSTVVLPTTVAVNVVEAMMPASNPPQAETPARLHWPRTSLRQAGRAPPSATQLAISSPHARRHWRAIDMAFAWPAIPSIRVRATALTPLLRPRPVTGFRVALTPDPWAVSRPVCRPILPSPPPRTSPQVGMATALCKALAAKAFAGRPLREYGAQG